MKMKFNRRIYLFIILLILMSFIKADQPVHCKKEKMVGTWNFFISASLFKPDLKDYRTSCGNGFPSEIKKDSCDYIRKFPKENLLKIKLGEDYKVYSRDNELKGRWTPLYDQGFNIFYEEMEFYANLKYYYDAAKQKFISNCNKTSYGWLVHDKNDKSKDWSCFYGIKENELNVYSNKCLDKRGIPDNLVFISKKESRIKKLISSPQIYSKERENKKFNHSEIVNIVNKTKLPWKAEINHLFHNKTLKESLKILGYSEENIQSILDTSNYDEQENPSFMEKKSLISMKSKKNGNKKSFKYLSNSFKNSKIGRKKDSKVKRINKKIEIENDSNDAKPEQVQKYLNKEIDEINVKELAKNWDWTNVNGVSYLTKPEGQGGCGSCYIFSTVGSLEARLRVLTNLEDKTEFSRQYPVSCNFYTEGCKGGYPYLVAKFFNEFEIIPDSCFKYKAHNDVCSNVCDYKKNPKKYTVSRYEFLGGFYGNSSEEDILKEIRARGPMPGHIKVNEFFMHYKSGIFTMGELLKLKDTSPSKITLRSKNMSFEAFNHGILIVGYGEENGIKFWKCKNSWGDNWGEDGYFRIQRGTDELAIESMGDAFRIKVEDRK
jgi:C1A family cysteine protease